MIPVPRPRAGVPKGKPGDGKTPIISWGLFQQRHATDDELRDWFAHEPMNLAIVTGPISGVVVIDADDPEALRYCTQRLPYTPWQSQTSRGFHLFYRYPSNVHVGNRARLATKDGRLGIDVKGDRGFVIAPGSIHASGVPYRFAGDWTIPRDDLPNFSPGWSQRPPSPPPVSTTARRPRPTGDLADRARRYLAAIPEPVIGEGSDVATFSAACHLLRGFGLDAGTTEALLWEWAGGRPGWSRTWIAEKVAHAERYGTEEIGGLR